MAWRRGAVLFLSRVYWYSSNHGCSYFNFESVLTWWVISSDVYWFRAHFQLVRAHPVHSLLRVKNTPGPGLCGIFLKDEGPEGSRVLWGMWSINPVPLVRDLCGREWDGSAGCGGFLILHSRCKPDLAPFPSLALSRFRTSFGSHEEQQLHPSWKQREDKGKRWGHFHSSYIRTLWSFPTMPSPGLASALWVLWCLFCLDFLRSKIFPMSLQASPFPADHRWWHLQNP